jgi:hypothetical protein
MLSNSENIVQLFEYESAIDEMAERLHQLHATDAAMETLVLASMLQWAEVRVMQHLARLRDVWRAVETGTDAIAKALWIYRQQAADVESEKASSTDTEPL